ncbi:MAG: carboxypeptidase-like regulatory domain-containing protein, partial [Planctomycetota bacterium]
ALGIPSVAAPLDAAPGADLDVVVDVPLRAWFAIRVVDAFERRPVPGAVVTVRWPECVDGELREVADDQGWAGFYDLPRATAVELRIEAEGYVTFGPTTTFTERSDEPLELPLWIWPEVAIRFDTEPEVERAADVRCLWRAAGDARAAWREAAVERVDGRLAASGVEGDDVELLVATDRGSCGPFAVAIERPVTELGRIELEPYRTARVRVLDAHTGFQLVDARVGVSAAPGSADGGLELSSRTDASGVAELVRVPANAPVLVCSAPGYADAVVTDFDDDAGVLDFGDVALRPRLAVRVQLVGGCPDPERWSIDTDLVADPPAVRFDEFGSARIVVDDTDTDLLLIDSEGRTEWLTPDRWPTFDEGAIEWPVSPERLRVELDGADASGPDGRDVHWLALTFESSAGFHTRNEKVVLSQPSRATCARSRSSTSGIACGGSTGRASRSRRGTRRTGRDSDSRSTSARASSSCAWSVDGVAAPAARCCRSTDVRSAGRLRLRGRGGRERRGAGAAAAGRSARRRGARPRRRGRARRRHVEVEGGGTHTVELRVPGVLDVAVRALDVGADEARAYGGAKLELRRGDDAFWLVKFDADAAGRARYAGLAGRRIDLSKVEAGGYWKRVHRVDVAAGDNPLATTLFALGEMHLRVVDGTGAAIAGAPLSLVHVELGESVADWLREGRIGGTVLTTDARGEFDLTGVPCGTYRVAVGGSDVGLVRTDGTRGTVVVP